MLTTNLSIIVHAQWKTVWGLLLDRIENPQSYQPLVINSKVIDRSDKWVIREVKVQDMIIRERLTMYDGEKAIHSELLEHPQYEGTIVTRVVPSSTNNPMAPVHLVTDFKLEHKISLTGGWAVITDKEMTTALNDEMELIKKKAEELEK